MITLLEKTVKVKCPQGNGYFIRWYFNGWHSHWFGAGDEVFDTVGATHNTNSATKVKVGCQGLSQNQAFAISRALLCKRVEVLLLDGWKAAIIDSTTMKIYDSFRNGYNCEFALTIYAKVADYTPVKPVDILSHTIRTTAL